MIHRNNRHSQPLGRPLLRAALIHPRPTRWLFLAILAAMNVSGGVWADTSGPLSQDVERNRDECDFELTPAQIERERARVLPSNAPRGGDDIYPWHAPITVHIVLFKDGTGGLPLEDVAAGMATVNELYEQTELRFFQFELAPYIYDDEYADLEKWCYSDDSGIGGVLRCDCDDEEIDEGVVCVDEDECPGNVCDYHRRCVGGENPGDPCNDDGSCQGGECLSEKTRLLREDNNPDTLDLYYVPILRGANGTTGSQGVIIESDNPTTTTPPHEIGHYFGLRHTHSTASGIECPERSNCDEAGDGLCDTPADPKLSGSVDEPPECEWNQMTCSSGRNQGEPCLWICVGGPDDGDACMDDDDCADSGTCNGPSNECPGLCTAEATGPPDCDGTTRYTPDTRNLMSYAPKPCRDNITLDQRDKMLADWLADHPYLYNRTRYVNTDGGDGSGTPQDPDGSLANAVADALAGDHLFLDSQLFSETPITITKPLSLKVWDPSEGAATIGP